MWASGRNGLDEARLVKGVWVGASESCPVLLLISVQVESLPRSVTGHLSATQTAPVALICALLYFFPRFSPLRSH